MLSRVADNLYWMSRYLERAEHTARLIDVHLNLILEQSPTIPSQQRRGKLLKGLAIPTTGIDLDDDYTLTEALTFASHNSASVVMCVAAARENARQVREQISSEMWMQLNKLYLDTRRAKMDKIWNQPHEFFMNMREGSHLFQGITDTTMNHNEGWHFIQLGRFIERGISLANLLDVNLGALRMERSKQALQNDDYLEWIGLLKSATAFEAYCKVYQADLRPDWIAEFMLFNAEFPHSVRFCVEMVLASLDAIAETTTLHKNNRLHRLAGRLQSALSFDEIGDILSGDLHAYLHDIKQQSAQIHDLLQKTYISYSVEAALN